MRTEHENGKLKPSTEPFDPKLKPLDAIPGVIPSYMITTRRVKPIAISSERHAVAGPWVCIFYSGNKGTTNCLD